MIPIVPTLKAAERPRPNFEAHSTVLQNTALGRLSKAPSSPLTNFSASATNTRASAMRDKSSVQMLSDVHERPTYFGAITRTGLTMAHAAAGMRWTATAAAMIFDRFIEVASRLS